MALKTAYQGDHGTFSEMAVLKYFSGKEIEQQGCRNFIEIMEGTENGTFDYGVLPVENTTTGIIARSYDLFRRYDVHAVGEINIPIIQNLIALPDTKIEEIREVYSHPEALSQCQEFFLAHPDIRQVPYQDTAKSVEYIRNCKDPTKAAIGSSRAAEYFGMQMMHEGIQDSGLNMTRFLVVTAKEEQDPEADKISMMMILNHRPGALYNVLGILSKNGVNILKLESRPIPGKLFEYMFYIDFTGNTNERGMKNILHELALRCIEAKILGCYKEAEKEFSLPER